MPVDIKISNYHVIDIQNLLANGYGICLWKQPNKFLMIYIWLSQSKTLWKIEPLINHRTYVAWISKGKICKFKQSVSRKAEGLTYKHLAFHKRHCLNNGWSTCRKQNIIPNNQNYASIISDNQCQVPRLYRFRSKPLTIINMLQTIWWLVGILQ